MSSLPRPATLIATGDRDLRDFATWWQAQLFYMRHWSGDLHRLDGDHDLIACESLL